MPLRRGRFAPLQSNKHEVTFSHLAQDSAANQTVTLATGTDSADKDNSTEVGIGSHIRWIFCEFNFSAEVISVVKTVHWALRYVPPGQTPSVANQLFGIDRSYVIKRGMEMLPKDVSTVYKRVFVLKIPKKYQRIQDQAQLQFTYIVSSTNATNACGIFVYKELY